MADDRIDCVDMNSVRKKLVEPCLIKRAVGVVNDKHKPLRGRLNNKGTEHSRLLQQFDQAVKAVAIEEHPIIVGCEARLEGGSVWVPRIQNPLAHVCEGLSRDHAAVYLSNDRGPRCKCRDSGRLRTRNNSDL